MKEFKPLILFLIRFLGTYVILTLLYKFYLDQYIPYNNPDPFTKLTSDTVAYGLRSLGFSSYSTVANQQPWMNLILNGKISSIINEGCNAISILIIYISFIVAFYTSFKQTFSFIFIGLVILLIMNIMRIMLLNWIFRYHYEGYGKLSHDYLFPAIIYGSVVILWLVWIRYFVMKFARENAK